MSMLFSRRQSILLLLFAAGLASISLKPADAAPTSDSAVEGLLVLRNGNVLKGQVLRLQDYYQVSMPKGQLQVRVDQVESFCHNLDEAYERRRAMRTGSTADSHLELARWCLRHDLREYAARELLDARAVDPHHRNLPLLERQLQHALRLASRENQPSTPVNILHENHEIELDLLERAPQWGRVLFVRQIQPLLVRSCATSGCHQQGSPADYHLNRMAVEGVGHPGATLSNLASTLAKIDWNNPEQSSLLARAGSIHGVGEEGQSKSLPTHQLQMLQTWVGQLAAANRIAQQSEHKIELAAHEQPSSGKKTAPVSPAPGLRIRLATAETADPFDPRVFNDRYASSVDADDQRTVRGADKGEQPPVSLTFPPHLGVPGATD